MLKKFVSSLLVILLIGCTSSAIDINNVSTELVKNLKLEDTVVKLDNKEIENLLYLDEGSIKKGVFYISNENTSDMVAILKGNNNKALLEDVNEYIEVLKTQNNNYFPEEVDKLNNAIIKEKDGYIYLIVSNNQELANDFISK